MSIDLSKLTLRELQKLSADVTKAINEFEQRKKREVLDEMRDVAQKHGFQLSDLLESNIKATRRSATPKFANPNNPSEKWSGRGRQPKWVNAAIAEGKTLSDLEIK